MSNAFTIDELRDLHAFACKIARTAGTYLRQDQIRRRKIVLGTEEKLNSVDLVTAADEGVEKLIRCASCAKPHHTCHSIFWQRVSNGALP
jgi:myo-inositol-1(or 4)-monophosphatase